MSRPPKLTLGHPQRSLKKRVRTLELEKIVRGTFYPPYVNL